MGAFSRTLEGRLERPVPPDFLARVAERARAGHFGGRTYVAEELVDGGGYRSAPRARGLRLEATSGRPGPLDRVTLEKGPDGLVRWRLDLARAMWRRTLVSFAIVAIAALVVAFRTHAPSHTASLLLAGPIVLVALSSFFSGASKAEVAARKAIEAALNAEFDDERVDLALASSGINAALSQDVVAAAAANGIALTEDERLRIVECDDATVLDQWLKNARKAKTALELFDGPRVRVDVAVDGEEAAQDEDEDEDEASVDAERRADGR